ncbi:MAG: hypothetical protein L0I24_08550 [Pseudonocardia sp.]|nr:hypothetical protein [Pseudonocardia sp.]
MRISRSGDDEAEQDEPGGGPMERVLRDAARQGDAHGDEVRALAVLDAGLLRHPDATDAERLPVLAYRAELLVRTGDGAGATAAPAAIRALDLDPADRARYADELAGLEGTT